MLQVTMLVESKLHSVFTFDEAKLLREKGMRDAHLDDLWRG